MHKSHGDGHIMGTCIYMCPLQERLLREREGLLHKFEWADTAADLEPDQFQDPSARSAPNPWRNHTNHSQATNTYRNRIDRFANKKDQRRNRKADVLKTVKEFARSAAGLDKTRPADLRPARVLEETVVYLCTRVLSKTGETFPYIYDFVFDRLRSVRQDLVIQRISDYSAICILESIIRFHVYSAHRCRHEHVSTFDPHINRKHLVDCLKKLMWLYEINDYSEDSRLEFEALYLIIAPESAEGISRALALQNKELFRNSTLLRTSLEMCLAFQCRNYAKYFRLVQQLPPNLASYVTQHAQAIRSKAFQAISKAYGVRTSGKLPLRLLESVLLYPDQKLLESDLSKLGVTIVPSPDGLAEKYALFNKPIVGIQAEILSCDIKIIGKSGEFLDPSSIASISCESICPWYSRKSS